VPGVARHLYEIMDERAGTLQEIDLLLGGVKAERVLIGGLAVGFHGRERGTKDVDMLVRRRALKPIAAAAKRHGFDVLVTPDMVRVYPKGGSVEDSIADLVAEEANPVLRAAFKATEPAVVLGRSVRIVKRGALVALKFHAAVSTSRSIEDKYQDLADIGRIIAKRYSPTDAGLARQVVAGSYPGADKDLDRLVDDMQRGRPVQF
jgi:hypothetical protein